jgi:outer membrane protein TolC
MTLRTRALSIAVLWLAVAGTGPTLALSQQTQEGTLRLTLRDALERAHVYNYDVRTAAADRAAARAELNRSWAVFLPQVTISETATSTNDPLNAFGFKLQQEIVTQADFDPAILNDPDRIDQFTTRFELRQPVLNPDGFLRHRAARSHAEAAELMDRRTRHHVDFQVKKSYYELVLAQRSLAVIDTALAAARTNRAQAQQFFEQGLITRADLLEADVRVLELQSKRTAADHGLHNASDALRYLIGIYDPVSIEPQDRMELQTVNVGVIDVAEVNGRRSDMGALRARSEAARRSVQASRLQFLPRLNVHGGYNLNDSRLFGSSGQSWTVGAVLQWNLFGGLEQVGTVQKARADLERSRITYESQSRRNQLDIESAGRDVRQTREQVELARAAAEQARETLRIRTDRYRQGLEKTTDVLNAEVRLANQRLMLLESTYRHLVSVFRLELLIERPLLD